MPRTLNADYDMAMRVGRGAGRSYSESRRDLAPERHEELLGCFIIALEDALAGVIASDHRAFPDMIEAAIEAFVAEADRLPTPAADPDRLFLFDDLLA
jgi:hypothetical protein